MSSVSETFEFDEVKYRADHKNLPLPTLRAKLKELDESETNHKVGLRSSLMAVVFTAGVSLVGTAYTGRHLYIIDQKQKILKEILRQRSDEESAPAATRSNTTSAWSKKWEQHVARRSTETSSDRDSTKANNSSDSDSNLGSEGSSRVLSPVAHKVANPFNQSTLNTTTHSRNRPTPSPHPDPTPASPPAQQTNPFSNVESSTRQQFRNASISTLYEERTKLEKTVSSLTTKIQGHLSYLERQDAEIRVSSAKRQLNTIHKMIEESPELDERQFRRDLQDLPLSSLQAMLHRLDDQRERLKVMGQLPLLPAQREENERKMSVVGKKRAIVNQAINETRDPELKKEVSVDVDVQPPFDEDVYRQQVQGEGKTTLNRKYIALLEEKELLKTRMKDTLSPQKRQSFERQLSVVDKKRAILLATIKREEDFDAKKYHTEVQKLPLAALQAVMSTLEAEQKNMRTEIFLLVSSVEKKKKEEEMTVIRKKRKIVGKLIQQRSNKEGDKNSLHYSPLDEPNVHFDEEHYRSQFEHQSLVNLYGEQVTLLRENTRLIREKQTNMSPEEVVEGQILLIGKKYAVIDLLIQEAEGRTSHPQSDDFDEEAYLFQHLGLSLAALQRVVSGLEGEHAVLRREAHSLISAAEKKKREDEMKIIEMKHKVVERLIRRKWNEGEMKVSDPEPRVEVDTSFNEEHYRSRFKYQPLANLEGERRLLRLENTRLIQEVQSKSSPQQREATEKHLSIVGKKRLIVNSLILEAEERAIYSQMDSKSSANLSDQNRSAAPPLLLDTSEEIVDFATSLEPPALHPMNMDAKTAKADLLSTETFDDEVFIPTRPDPSSDAFYWSSEILD
ncbi:hypothetical protein FRB91_006662 [Serendipita sp. 411]|nr:hypothetical protein FRB91_006662 [Serendipita sp. 411]